MMEKNFKNGVVDGEQLREYVYSSMMQCAVFSHPVVFDSL